MNIFRHLETFETHGPKDSHYVLRSGRMPDLPFPVEVGHRRDGTHFAAHAIPIRLTNPDDDAVLARLVTELGLAGAPLFDVLNSVKQAGIVLCRESFEVVLQKVVRPGAPQGIEWNGFGGAVGVNETRVAAVRREFEEEAKGMRLAALWNAVPFFQAATGFYTEVTSVYIALVTGDPHLATDEGALEWKVVPMDVAPTWIRSQNSLLYVEKESFCPVDGKILLGLLEFERMLRRHEIIDVSDQD